MRVVDYSDSEDDKEDAPVAKKLKTELPSLPSIFLDLYSSTVRASTQDDPTLHGGRKRAIPHAEGNWPSHVYLEWHASADELESLSAVVEQVKTNSTSTAVHTLLQNKLGVSLPLHISLSRPLVLKTEQKDLFLDNLRSTIRESSVREFPVHATGVRWHPNEDGSRHFLVMKTRSQGDELGVLLDRCNKIAAESGQPELYTTSGGDTDTAAVPRRPDQFHISLAWALRQPADTNGGLTELQLPAAVSQKLQELRVLFSAVKVRIGQDVTTIPLSQKRGGRASLFTTSGEGG